MRIVGLKLRNYRIFRELDWEICGENLVALIGNNGGGKSSILDAICLGIAHFATIISLESGHREIIYADGISVQDISIGSDSCSVDVQIELEDSLMITVSTQYFKNNQSGSTRILYGNSTKKIPALLKNRYIQSMPVLSYFKVGRADFSLKKEEINHESVKPTRASTYSGAFTNEYPTVLDFQKWYLREKAVENQEKVDRADLSYSIDSLAVVKEAVERLFKVMLSDDSVELTSVRSRSSADFWLEGTPGFLPGQLAVVKQQQQLPVESLSHGEKSVLILTIEIARRLFLANQTANALAGNGIVLIDEIELHLHPSWQREILPALRSTFPGIQFIVTTHSPQTLSTLTRNQIYVVDDGKLFNADTDPLGRDTNGILEELMDVDKRPKKIDDLVDEIMALLYADEPNFEQGEAQLSRLKEMVAESDPILTRIEALIRRRKALA